MLSNRFWRLVESMVVRITIAAKRKPVTLDIEIPIEIGTRKGSGAYDNARDKAENIKNTFETYL